MPDFPIRMAKPVTVAQVLGLVRGWPLDFAPGSSAEFSNTNYFLLGAIIERVSGQPYAAYLQRAIFTPLQLQGTGGDANYPDPRTHARGYSSWDTAAPYTDMSWWLGADVLYASAVDLWRWDEAVTHNTLISKAATTDMLAPRVARCARDARACPYPGLAAYLAEEWYRGTLEGHPIIGGGGDFPGFTASNRIMPDDGITIILLSNQADSGAGSYLGLALAQIMLGQAGG